MQKNYNPLKNMVPAAGYRTASKKPNDFNGPWTCFTLIVQRVCAAGQCSFSNTIPEKAGIAEHNNFNCCDFYKADADAGAIAVPTSGMALGPRYDRQLIVLTKLGGM